MRERTVLLIVAIVLAVGFAAEYRVLFFSQCATGDRLPLACMIARLHDSTSHNARDER